MSLVETRIEGAVGRLTLNDPTRANVLSYAMMGVLQEALAGLVAAADVRVIVLAAEGRIFCAGHDLAEMAGLDRLGAEALFARCGALMSAIVRSAKPVIAQVQGAAVAAGCQLVASCDMAYAAAEAKFAVSGIDVGLFCSTPAVALARSIGRKAALEMLLTGRFVGAAEAAELGLINGAVPAGELESSVAAVARTIAAKAPEAVAIGKAGFEAQLGLDLDAAYALAGAHMTDNLMLACARDGIRGFLAKSSSGHSARRGAA